MNQPHVRPSDMELNEIYFWTSTIVDWKHLLTKEEIVRIVIDSLNTLVSWKCISVYAFVIMPNHVHFIWEMMSMNKKEMPDSSFTKFTAHKFATYLKTHHPKVLDVFKVDKRDRAHQFWQRDPLAVRIIDREMLLQKLKYIHNNPLKEHWNLAQRPEEYQWSSAAFYETEVENFKFLTHYAERF